MTLPDDKTRFECELDFVTMLGDSKFVQYLQKYYFDDEYFVDWIKYLQYFRQPPYVRFVKNPISLFYLENLQHLQFRQHLLLTATNDGQVENTNLKYFEAQLTKFYKTFREVTQEGLKQADKEARQ
ncbi:SOH1_family protein [Hexamita inflata]|uniref:Mediator of RNA polymerase II transcription subunit 31 n=1 Tax=Hexamita inflata TaxID=28002 RepID=A0AA86RFV6_9EUKA|nr:SOH1 family protein [Hexamita inflata]